MARVFISYKRVDKAKVFKIKDKIQSAIGEDCWIDLDGIESDAIFKSVIINAINTCEIFLFMYSKAHSTIVDFEHDWTVRELSFAELKKKRIVFINIDGSTLSDLFLFDYANKQQVDATSTEALDHLCTDLQKWLGSSTQSVTKQRNQAESLTPSEMVKLGEDYYFGENGKQKDYVKAVEWFRKAAERGNANAQCYLGYCFKDGAGVDKNYTEAVNWYRKAAEQGNPEAKNSLGVCYQNGYGVVKDLAEAVKWYRKAAEQGYNVAQVNLGMCYESGQGVLKDLAEAVKWYRKAAEQGNPEAKNSLGVCYQNGYGVAKDLVEAVKWYRQAAVQGNSYAQRNLGVCYEHGYGVAENQSEAIKWYRQAALQENFYAKARLKALGINS
ncbi:MAG: toll/interleukin-1 receptor domain-containing protein [Bacteroidales bacterium]|nr:toll/interleukin-1 receptor domain-containing protein [Bacteroidales bacterium]MDD6621381.1 toll/interleukin-1 receptor domain-containing protein [Bacteroidales bacterium]MDD6669695.1 toll/interleukin-1 receptor domain-containing protein [Bacteroidales bacterium]